MKVKICGINKIEHAQKAFELGSDYLGLLLGITHTAEDKITLNEGKDIIQACSNIPIDRWVMVTHLLNFKEIEPYIIELGIKNIQLHDDIPIGEIEKLRSKYPYLYIIKAVHVTNQTALVKALKLEKIADAIILDSRTVNRLGGTGLTHDWDISMRICQACHKPVFLAGGLNPENVSNAINAVHPYGVDVNSGVEDDNGEKSYEKMRAFIRIAKGGGGNNDRFSECRKD